MTTKNMTEDHKKWYCTFYPDFKKALDMMLTASPNIFLKVSIFVVRSAANTLNEIICGTDSQSN